jgi:hypothetical protein
VDNITDNETFKKTLSALPLAQQRQVGARFVGHVLDLTEGRCTKQAQILAEKNDVSPEELEMAYHAVHAIYVDTRPRSHLSLLDYGKQATHLVAEACMTCVAPTYGDYGTSHLAENVASYCRMARMCASIQHDADNPSLSNAEEAMKKETEAQYEILNKYLEENT